jgi:cobyrinic acid a,c-diamide synthase
VVLVLDCARVSQSVAATVLGFQTLDPSITIAGVLLNNVGSVKHETLLRTALAPLETKIFGVVPRSTSLTHPSRHLGLVQAKERPDLETFLEDAADLVARSVDLDALAKAARPLPLPKTPGSLPPPAQTIAIAQDEAFAFSYPHLLQDWRTAGANLTFFSPLADERVPKAELVFLPGGYPELHAGRLAAAVQFLESLRKAAQHADIYGECGGYMVLGHGLTDADGNRHQMAGLLDLETSFAARRLHLGYRELTTQHAPLTGTYRGHEFHYATTLKAEGKPLFTAKDTFGIDLPDMGLVNGLVSGSFAHIIDRVVEN